MALFTNEQIGRLAESLAEVHLSRPVMGRFRRPLFRPTSLGEKYPTVDFLVDVLGRMDDALGFFFIQVKGTAPRSAGTVRLPVKVSADGFNLLAGIPAPTYLVGVDVIAEASYLIAAHKKRKGRLSSITKAYDLRSDAVRIELYREVLAYWRANKPLLWRTRFKDVG
jgi:hypothetical protein